MESLLLEMHRKMDLLKVERNNADAEAKLAVKHAAEVDAEIKYVKQENSS
jgi:hypothetical protein